MMKKKRIVLGFLVLLIIAPLLYLSSSMYLHSTSQKLRTYRILFLYYVYDIRIERPPFEALWQYNTAATLGLEFAIDQELKNLGINFEVVRFEKSKSQHGLNKTFLDSADLIVVGGMYYWWKYASYEDRFALFQTSTPIIASVCYGVGPNASLLRMMTGVWASTDSVVVGINIVGGPNTFVKFTEYAPVPLRDNGYLAGWGTLINANLSRTAEVYAYAIREGQKYPLLIFNRTKNFLINAFTYKGTKQYNQWELGWPKLLLVALNELFNFLPDHVLSLRIFPRPELTIVRIGNFYLILDQRFIIPTYIFVLLTVLLVKYKPIKINYKALKIKFIISAKEFKTTIFRMQQATLILFIALSLVNTYIRNVPLIISTMLWQSVLATIIFIILLYMLNHCYS